MLFENVFCKGLFRIGDFSLKGNLSIALTFMNLTWKLLLQSSESMLSSKIFS